MTQLKQTQMENDYNSDPVYYCKSCLSLAIQTIGEPEYGDSVCLNCNRTDVGQTDIFTWREIWKKKYGEYPENQ